jgi:hypothetical protein
MNGFLASLVLSTSMLAATPEAQPVSSIPQAAGWHTDYGEALTATKTSGYPLLIVLNDPNKVETQISPARFRKEDTQAALLKPYVLCQVDVTTEYGKQVAAAFKAQKFPHTAIIDKTGSQIIFRKTGRFVTDDWVTTLVDYKKGVAVVKQAAVCFT